MKSQSNLKKSLVWVLIITAILLLPLLIWNSSMQAKSLRKQDRQDGAVQELTPVVIEAANFAESAPLRDLAAAPPDPAQAARMAQSVEGGEINPLNELPIRSRVAGATSANDPVRQSNIIPGLSLAPNPVVNFDGIDMDSLAPTLNGRRFAPPSPSADVGPNHVVMAVNTAFQVYNKSGTPLTPVTPLSSLFAALGPPFNNPGAGDERNPTVLYDPLADRWLISEWVIAAGESHQLTGISKTGDPTGQYFIYDFPMPPGRLTADPRWGVWPDGYYLSTNDFNSTVAGFLGAGLYAFERNKMLAGDPTARIIRFNTGPTNGGGFLPTDLDGVATPPVGTPNLFIRFEADEFGAPTDLIRVVEFRPNFANPLASTLTQLLDIPTAPFDARNPPGRTEIEQPPPAGAADSLDAVADRLMHRLAYRTLAGGTQSYVLNFTVNVSGENPTSAATYQGGVRWMELRRNATTGAVTINQQATYAPGAGNGATGRNLWMASVAQDGEGNIGLGASASSTTLIPTAIYTGRLASDPANTLPQGEVDAMSAVTKGVQISTGNRWGDYSSMNVDPTDDCTFWITSEYLDAPTASFDWNTRICSFKVNPSCVSPAKGTIQGTITDCVTRQPVANAEIRTPEGYFRQTDANGNYSMTVAPGTYTVTVAKPGSSPATGRVTVTGPDQTAIFSPCLTTICSSITVNPASLPAGTVGAPYSQTFTATGGTALRTFALTGTLPAGLSFSAATATLSGTPTQTGSFPITVTATDANGCTGSRSYTLVINCPTITLSPASLPAGTVGAAYSQTVTASGGIAPHTFSLSAGRLPSGLSLSSGGSLSGTPAQTGSFSFTIKATDVNGCMGEQAYMLVIAARSAREVCLQDDRNGNVLLINTLTGMYKFCGKDGVTFEGRGTITRRGNRVQLQDGHRVSARLVFFLYRLLSGRAEAQPVEFGPTYIITDRNPNDNKCACH
jgi:hypothetical protein